MILKVFKIPIFKSRLEMKLEKMKLKSRNQKLMKRKKKYK